MTSLLLRADLLLLAASGAQARIDQPIDKR
jgi:hypothetical protein